MQPKGPAVGVIGVGPQREVPGQVVASLPVVKARAPVPEFDLGNGMKFSWMGDESGSVKPSSKDCRHVLQTGGGIIANCYGKKALTLPKHTTFGNRLEWVLGKQELKEDFVLMVALTLELAEFTESTCPNFADGFNLTMAQFAEVGVLGLRSLENMPAAEVKATLSHLPARQASCEKNLFLAKKSWRESSLQSRQVHLGRQLLSVGSPESSVNSLSDDKR